jgi:hypothetical protein
LKKVIFKKNKKEFNYLFKNNIMDNNIVNNIYNTNLPNLFTFKRKIQKEFPIIIYHLLNSIPNNHRINPKVHQNYWR